MKSIYCSHAWRKHDAAAFTEKCTQKISLEGWRTLSANETSEKYIGGVIDRQDTRASTMITERERRERNLL